MSAQTGTNDTNSNSRKETKRRADRVPELSRKMFRSLVNGAKKLATGESGGAQIGQLFPKVDPKVDGEDCLKDCDNCPTHYPKGFKIEESDDLYGGIKGWSTHVLVATGKADWTHNVADEKGSVMQAIEKADKPSNGVRKLPTPGPPDSVPCTTSTGRD